jgi:hypothetical protein
VKGIEITTKIVTVAIIETTKNLSETVAVTGENVKGRDHAVSRLSCTQFLFGMHAVLLSVIVESCLISGIKVEIIQIN